MVPVPPRKGCGPGGRGLSLWPQRPAGQGRTPHPRCGVIAGKLLPGRGTSQPPLQRAGPCDLVPALEGERKWRREGGQALSAQAPGATLPAVRPRWGEALDRAPFLVNKSQPHPKSRREGACPALASQGHALPVSDEEPEQRARGPARPPEPWDAMSPWPGSRDTLCSPRGHARGLLCRAEEPRGT